jgi:hypothetical protein
VGGVRHIEVAVANWLKEFSVLFFSIKPSFPTISGKVFGRYFSIQGRFRWGFAAFDGSPGSAILKKQKNGLNKKLLKDFSMFCYCFSRKNQQSKCYQTLTLEKSGDEIQTKKTNIGKSVKTPSKTPTTKHFIAL